MRKFELYIVKVEQTTHSFFSNLTSFSRFFFSYVKKKLLKAYLYFEQKKNMLVKFLIMKRGRYNRPFLHFATLGVLGVGVGLAPFLADTFPVFSQSSTVSKVPSPSNKEQSIVVDNNVFQTQISQKPREGIISYTVAKGDTISTIATKFGISSDTIRWENDLTDDDLSIGQELKIPPVTGIVYKVQKGDTIYTIANKYNTNPQEIVDFPFNTFANPETFTLVEGQMLIVPDGVKKSEQTSGNKSNTGYIAQLPPPPSTSGIGGYIWPLRGGISQYFSWFHPGVDITSPIGTPIVAAKPGKVIEVGTTYDGGYGTHVIIGHDDGRSTLYAHMAYFTVSLGQIVSAGEQIGVVGMTGRTTGPHLHFEVRTPGGNINPLSVL